MDMQKGCAGVCERCHVSQRGHITGGALWERHVGCKRGAAWIGEGVQGGMSGERNKRVCEWLGNYHRMFKMRKTCPQQLGNIETATTI